jgi:hypothetical protein
MDEQVDIWPPHEVFYLESMLSVTRMAMVTLSQLQYCLDELDAGKTVDDNRVLDLVQQLISSAGAVSRYFWPSVAKGIHGRRAERLKAALGITEENPLKNRKVRNFMEHFDENLDDYLSKMLSGVIIPSYVGDKPEVNGGLLPNFFRAYYIQESTFCVLGLEYDMMPVVYELTELHKKLIESNSDGGKLPS